MENGFIFTSFFRLVCEVSYICANQVGPPLSFRKYFKFQVVKPLDVKTKFYNAEVILMHRVVSILLCTNVLTI